VFDANSLSLCIACGNRGPDGASGHAEAGRSISEPTLHPRNRLINGFDFFDERTRRLVYDQKERAEGFFYFIIFSSLKLYMYSHPRVHWLRHRAFGLHVSLQFEDMVAKVIDHVFICKDDRKSSMDVLMSHLTRLALNNVTFKDCISTSWDQKPCESPRVTWVNPPVLGNAMPILGVKMKQG